MSFLNPVAFALAALAVPIVAMYFLKLRREERVVSSIFLWRHLVRDTAANAPWQRLRPNLLLFLQLLFLALIVLSLVRPYIWSDAASGDHIILVLDTSASMSATDETPNRLAEAVRRARDTVAGLPADARVSLITAGAETEVPISGATDRAEIYRALDGIRGSAGPSDLSAALNLAGAVAAREQDPETIIFSDGNVTLSSLAGQDGAYGLPGRVRYVSVGRGAAEAATTVANQGIMALSLRRTAGGQSMSAFVQVTHYGQAPVERRIALYAGNELLAARSLALAPDQPQALTFEDLPVQVGTVEARLEGEDLFSLDDTAWAALASDEPLRVDVVGPGNRFLETALALLPGLQVTTISPEDYRPREAMTQTAVLPADLTIFDGVQVPETLPEGALLFLAPIGSTGLFTVTGQIETPVAVAARADDPLLRYVDLRGLQIQEAAAIPLPEWARAVVLVAGSDACAADREPCPLLFAGQAGERRAAVLAFDVRKSDLPLRVAFPLLLANLLDYLSVGTNRGDLPEQVRPGDPVPIIAPAEATAVTITRPDGTTETLPVQAGRAVFGNTGEVGVYEVAWASGGAGGGTLGRFAVNLFNPQESAIAPQSTLAVTGTAAGGEEAGRQSRQEWWRPIAWLALVALAAEWLYAHRGQLVRLYGGLKLRTR